MDSVYPIPMRTANADPRKVGVEDAIEALDENGVPIDGIADLEGAGMGARDKLFALANSSGNIAPAIDKADLVKLGADCVADYESDKQARKEWETDVNEALQAASQATAAKASNYPWPGSSNVKFPILTSAVLQYNARMYPAVIKGDEAVLCKVIGSDDGKPQMMPGPDGRPMVVPQQGPDGQPMMGPDGQPMPVWRVPPGAKTKRAQRVSEYMNYQLFYAMEDWESDTDSLLMQLPVVGCAFRKVWWDRAKGQNAAAMVSALRIFVPEGAKSCETTPRLTEEIPDIYPHQIDDWVRSDHFIDAELWGSDDKEGKPERTVESRLLLEQHRLIDLDDDGMEEPYIVTIDHSTTKVLRVQANFGPEDVTLDDAGEVVSIKRGRFFIKYDLFPHPEGKFYGIGLGHLLKQMGSVINTAVNQLMDAGHAQTAGGGFIGSGVRLQSRAGGSVVRMVPGEYRTVDVPGEVLRNAIVERTLPNVSPVTFQVLDLILGAARDISGAKDVITGEASNNGQVGTTLALIEQGLQVFNATAKRTFRSLKEEYTLLKENLRKYGGERTAADYAEVLDDQDANFEADFAAKDMDIRPVSDPSSVTRMQKMAKSQFIMSTMEALAGVGGDPREALRRAYEAADIEDIDKLLPPPPPGPPPGAEQQQPDPRMELEMQAMQQEMEAEGQKREIDMAGRQQDMQSKGQQGQIRAAAEQAKAQRAQAQAEASRLDVEKRRYQMQRDMMRDRMTGY